MEHVPTKCGRGGANDRADGHVESQTGTSGRVRNHLSDYSSGQWVNESLSHDQWGQHKTELEKGRGHGLYEVRNENAMRMYLEFRFLMYLSNGNLAGI